MSEHQPLPPAVFSLPTLINNEFCATQPLHGHESLYYNTMSQWGFPLLSIIRYSTLVTMRWLALVGVPALFYCRLISNTTYRFSGSSSPQPTNFPFQSLAIIDHLLDGQSVQVGAGTPLSLTDIMFQKIPLLL